MRVSKSSTVTAKTKPSLKKQIEPEISIVKFDRSMNITEATAISEALAEELAATGIHVVRVRRISQEFRTIFAIHFLKRADAVCVATHVQKTRHNSLFAA